MTLESVRPRILLVDDDELIRETFALFFGQVGWPYELSANPELALMALEKDSYDLVLTDMMMPVMNGLELMRSIHKIKPSQPVMIVTGVGDNRDAIQSLKEGALDIIQKPVDFEALEIAVLRVLNAQREEYAEAKTYQFLTEQISTYVFSSLELAQLKPALPIVERLYQAGVIDVGTKLKIDLAFQEAITNSLDHGNLELESKWKEQITDQGIDQYSQVKRTRLADSAYAKRSITLTSIYSHKKLSIRIQDQGPGFKSASPVISAEGASLACHGRGLTIILGCMDEVRYNQNGREIVLIKNLEEDKSGT